MAKKRAIVYIDGFNLYFGLKFSVKPRKKPEQEEIAADSIENSDSEDATKKLKTQKIKRKLTKRSYWLDIQRLAEYVIRDADLVAVKYFTARIKGNYQKQLRQNAFLNAIQTYCPKLQIFEGRYLLRRVFCSQCRQNHEQFVCPICQNVNVYPEEKKSDVNIATQMMQDAYGNRFDIAYLVSSDSDFVPPVKAVCNMTPPKIVAVAFPPGQGMSKELREAASFSFFIPPSGIKQSWLPDTVTKPDGACIVIPEEWRDDTPIP
jgi:uncharacterized LabA/DUF88 family protein